MPQLSVCVRLPVSSRSPQPLSAFTCLHLRTSSAQVHG